MSLDCSTTAATTTGLMTTFAYWSMEMSSMDITGLSSKRVRKSVTRRRPNVHSRFVSPNLKSLAVRLYIQVCGVRVHTENISCVGLRDCIGCESIRLNSCYLSGSSAVSRSNTDYAIVSNR